LGPELAVELWIQTLAAAVKVQAFATFSAITRLMFLAGGHGFTVRMVSAFHDTGLSNTIMIEEYLPVKKLFECLGVFRSLSLPYLILMFVPC
jgi:hypothetical protein